MLSDGEIAQGFRGIAHSLGLFKLWAKENNKKETIVTLVRLCKRTLPMQTLHWKKQ